MVFASNAFIFLFLPIAFAGYFLATRFGATYAVAWLTLSSLAFYAAWNPAFVTLLLCSIAFNFSIGRALLKRSTDEVTGPRDWLLALGIAGNLLPLIYFKYLGALLSFAHQVSLISHDFDFKVILPLGISFFTFTQMGYLVGCHDGEGKDIDLLRYSTFVTFFPHLIAGPILHIREIGPQLLNSETFRIRWKDVAVGISFFIIGLSKKVLLADPLAEVVKIGFAHPGDFRMCVSWLYALAYSLQLYFDFSGYSDMAIGLAAMFGIRFPINFDSPYKSTSMIDYWQRFHATLTRYLTLYLYNPIALRIQRRRVAAGLSVSRGKRQSLSAFGSLVVIPIFFTMALAGIWHGSGLQYLLFGLMHAVYLTMNHAWRAFGPKLDYQKLSRWAATGVTCCKVLLTFVAAVAAMVMFRASSAGDAAQMLAGMSGLHGFDALPIPSSAMSLLEHTGPIHTFLTKSHHLLVVPMEDSIPAPASLALRFFIVWGLPNSQQIMAKFSPTISSVRGKAPQWLSWQPTISWALGLGFLLAICLMSFQQTKVFLYFQF
jgi:D-alanyl-lipoteichoic acid acyltransferase DltB (MBOAT superfamily)